MEQIQRTYSEQSAHEKAEQEASSRDIARSAIEQDRRAKVAQKAAETAISDIDEILDEIDEVLEANAEEFVQAYVQKGGQ